MRPLGVLVVLALSLFLPAWAAEAASAWRRPAFIAGVAWASPEDEKNSIDRKRLKDAALEERRLVIELDELEKKAGRIEDHLVGLDQELEAARKKLQDTDGEIKQLQKSLADLKKYMERRIQALYRMRDVGMLQVLLQAESLQDLLYRYRVLSQIVQRDKKALTELSHQKAKLKVIRVRFEEEQKRQAQLRAETEKEKQNLLEARAEKTAVLRRVHQRKEYYAAVLRDQEESRQRLLREAIIEPREKFKPVPSPAGPSPDKSPPTPRNYTDFAALKGRLPRPVAGPVMGRFGRNPGPFNTQVVRHGLVLAAAPGAEIKAVADGEVLYLGWLKGYGQIIILDHGQRYYTLIGGLAGLKHKVGQWVQRGEIVGFVPRTGQLEKKDIYFEIRHRGLALDPAEWLGRKDAG
ncbi:MAG: peptidoglycan DD-metalloendopeptidase family protein [Pseudomonadota bacterium]